MPEITERTVLWEPSPERRAKSHMANYMRWLAERKGQRFGSYQALWQWSVTDLDAFWTSLWDYFDIRGSAPYTRVLDARKMPGARWFQGARLNYAEHAFRHVSPAYPAIIALSEVRPRQEVSWARLRADDALVARIKESIRRRTSARYVPTEVFAVTDVPRTLTGKKMELPIRKLLLGHPLEKVASPGAMANPDSLVYFVDLARKLNR